tara:strand:- start:173 stop:511 length:339 start_codon:yes stop_codon:yes gene_type:complete
MARDSNREQTVSPEGMYDDLVTKREKKRIVHYTTPVFKNPTALDRRRMPTVKRVWSTGDTLMKYAAEYYGDVSYWYVIAWYNFKPTDAHFDLGDVVFVPTDLGKALTILRSY